MKKTEQASITPERAEKIRRMLTRRQVDFELYLDDVSSSQNLSAILRSADAVGILRLFYALRSDQTPKIHKTITQGAHRWVRKRRIPWQERCDFLEQKRAQGLQIVAAHLQPGAQEFRSIDYTRPTLLIVGNEKEGVSPEILDQVDQAIVIPMMGMVQSLNVSAAATVILYEMQRQRQAAGLYEEPTLSQEEIEAITQGLIYRDSVARRSKGKIPAEEKLWLQW